MTGTNVVRTARDGDPRQVLEALGIPGVNGVIVLNGGTADLPADIVPRALEVLRDGLVRVAAEDHLLILTGGTDAGIFRLLGQVIGDGSRPFPLVGVAPVGLVREPGRASRPNREAIPLERHHSGFVLVDSQEWGGETAMMLALAGELSRRAPSVAVLASGGSIARRELRGHVAAGRPVVVLSGSGRLADEVAEAIRRPQGADPDLARILAAGHVVAFALEREPAALATLIRRELSRRPRAG